MKNPNYLLKQVKKSILLSAILVMCGSAIAQIRVIQPVPSGAFYGPGDKMTVIFEENCELKRYRVKLDFKGLRNGLPYQGTIGVKSVCTEQPNGRFLEPCGNQSVEFDLPHCLEGNVTVLVEGAKVCLSGDYEILGKGVSYFTMGYEYVTPPKPDLFVYCGEGIYFPSVPKKFSRSIWYKSETGNETVNTESDGYTLMVTAPDSGYLKTYWVSYYDERPGCSLFGENESQRMPVTVFVSPSVSSSDAGTPILRDDTKDPSETSKCLEGNYVLLEYDELEKLNEAMENLITEYNSNEPGIYDVNFQLNGQWSPTGTNPNVGTTTGDTARHYSTYDPEKGFEKVCANNVKFANFTGNQKGCFSGEKDCRAYFLYGNMNVSLNPGNSGVELGLPSKEVNCNTLTFETFIYINQIVGLGNSNTTQSLFSNPNLENQEFFEIPIIKSVKTYRLIDPLGRVLMENKVSSSEDFIRIQKSNIYPGIFYLSISDGLKSETKVIFNP